MLIHNANVTGSMHLNGMDMSTLTGSVSSTTFNQYTSSTNEFTGSANTRLNSLDNSSGSFSTRVTSLESFSASLDATFATDAQLSSLSGSVASRLTTDESAITNNSSSFASRVTNNESNISSLQTASGSFSTRVTSNESNISSLQTASGSFSTRTANLETASGSFSTRVTSNESNISGLQTASGSFSTRTTNNESSLTSLNSKSGSFATTGSNTFNGTQTITGSLFITQNLTVLGSSSISYVSQSNLNIGTNLITVNAQNPTTRFGGLAVIDSGSAPQVSGSWLFDSIQNRWIMIHEQTNGVVTSSIAIMGPETYNSLGNETTISANRLVKGYPGASGEHIGDSQISDDGTTVSIPGRLVVTGSITGSLDGSNITNSSISNAKLANSSVTVNAGTGMSGGGSVALGSSITLTNTAPDQTVTLTNGSNITITGTYPNFTLTNGITNNNQLTNGAGYITGITSGNVTTALGYTPVPTTRTLTINGTSFDLSADRSWTIASGVSSFNTRTGAITLQASDISGLGAGIVSGSSQVTGLTSSNLSSTANISNSQLANSSVTVSAGTGMSGGGSVSLGGTITLTNTGLLSGTAGTGISVSTLSQNLTITNTGLLSGTAGTGISVSTVNQNLTITNTGLLTGTAGTGISVSTVNQNLTITNTGLLSGTAGTGISVSTVNQNLTITNTGLLGTTAGTGISISTVNQNSTITNTGVTSNIAGTGISVSGATGGVTITNTGVTSLTAGSGISISGATGGVTVTNTITNNNQLTNGAGYITSAGTAAAVSQTVSGTNSAELVRGNMADNDQFRILVGGTASNSGFVEIATADDGTEPIHVRQYTGVFSSLVRTATLLDGSGNTSFPGIVTAGSDFRAPIFYDSNNTGFYLDPASTSVLNALTVGGSSVVTNNGGSWGISVTGTAGSTQTLALIGLGNGSMNVNNGNTATYRNENSLGAALPYAPVLHVGGGDTMWQAQGSYGTSGNGTFYFRQGYNGSWGNWLTMLSSANFNSYSPTLTGGGASGTWGISISGNAATAGGFTPSQSTIANGIVVRDPSGYIFGNYINMTDDGNPGGGTSISSFITKQGDNYYRSVSPTNAMVSIRGVASGNWGINVTGTAGSLSSMNISQFTNNSGYITGLSFDGLSSKTGGTGTYQTSGDFRAPIFYDSNNTGFYLDPNSTSNLGGLTLACNVSTGRSSYGRANANLVLLADSTYGASCIDFRSGVNYPSDGAQIYYETATNGSSGETSRLVIRTENDADDSILIRGGFIELNSTTVDGGSTNPGFRVLYNSNARMYTYSDNTTEFGSFRAPIFYDSNNTGYYFDGASTSVMNSITFGTSTTGATLSGNSDWGVRFSNSTGYIQLGPANGSYAHIYTDRGNFYLNVNDLYLNGNLVPIYGYNRGGNLFASAYYDANDTGYYIDPNSASRIRSLNMGYVGGQVYLNSDGGTLFFNANGESDIQGYSIGTTMENYGGNYTKLTIDWHTGIRIGAANGYGGIRFYNNSVKYYGGSQVFSVAEGDNNVRVNNVLFVSGDARAPIFYDINNTSYYVDPGGGNARIGRDIYVEGFTGGSFGNRLIVGATSTPYTLQDANLRPTIYMTGAYPVLTLNHTETGNTQHGPTIQFAFNGLSNRQWVIGCNGQGTFMDFGFSSSGYSNTDFNPHNGISGYNGNTIMRIIDNAVGIGGDWGNWGAGNPSFTLDVRGTAYASSDMRAPIFYDSSNTGYYLDLNGTSYLYHLILSGNSYFRPQSWIQFDSSYGLYWPNNYGAHLNANDNGSYGSLQILGEKNGWRGLHFGGGTGITLMMNEGEFGFHRQAVGWVARFTSGTGHFNISGTAAGVDWGNVSSKPGNLLYYNTWFGNSYLGSGGDFYCTILYDTNNSGYYLDLASRSNLNALTVNGGTNYFYGITYFETNNGGQAVNNSDSAKLQAYSSSNNSAFMSFHRGGYYAVNFGLDNDNVMRIGGWSAAANRWQLDMSGNMTVAGDVTAYSDARVKTNVNTIENALEKTLALRGVTYNRTDSEDVRTKVGVIAQEIIEVLPEVVSQDNDGMYNVSYGNITALLIEAIKEQQSQIEELKSIVNALTK